MHLSFLKFSFFAQITSSMDEVFSASSSQPDFGSAFAKMFLTLIALVGLLFLSLWFVKKLMHARLEKNHRHLSIHVLEKRMLSPKTALYLIEADGKKMLVAESQLEVKFLSDIPSQAMEKGDKHL